MASNPKKNVRASRALSVTLMSIRDCRCLRAAA